MEALYKEESILGPCIAGEIEEMDTCKSLREDTNLVYMGSGYRKQKVYIDESLSHTSYNSLRLAMLRIKSLMRPTEQFSRRQASQTARKRSLHCNTLLTICVDMSPSSFRNSMHIHHPRRRSYKRRPVPLDLVQQVFETHRPRDRLEAPIEWPVDTRFVDPSSTRQHVE